MQTGESHHGCEPQGGLTCPKCKSANVTEDTRTGDQRRVYKCVDCKHWWPGHPNVEEGDSQ